MSAQLKQVTPGAWPSEVSPSQTAAQGGTSLPCYEGNGGGDGGGAGEGHASWLPEVSLHPLGGMLKTSPALLMTFWFPVLLLQLWGRERERERRADGQVLDQRLSN